MGKSQREKGKRGERDVCDRLGRDLALTANRGAPMQARGGDTLPDVVVPEEPWLWIEVSYGKAPSPHGKMRQAQEACGSDTPIVVTKRDREEPLVTMTWDDWTRLMRQAGHGRNW